MASMLEKLAQSASMLDGLDLHTASNGAEYEVGLQRQYLAEETQEYVRQYGSLASDVYIADVQGTDPDNFEEYKTVKLRSSKASTATTGELMPDDWQSVHIIDPAWITYLPQGAYLKYANNTWIAYKGQNMASVLGSAIVRRCNAVIHLLDWYGNIITVPMSYARMATQGNASHASENSIVAKNYISCVCQYNSLTKDFHENSRMILGKAAYQMRGLNDFTREFTDDADSVHILTFTIERTEPLEQDSIELQCADYYSFRWELNVSADTKMNVGASQQITVQSIRCGEIVESGEEKPISYLFESSSPEIISIDETGLMTASAEGSAEITIRLAQNPEIKEVVSVTAEDVGGTYVAFTSTAVDALRKGESIEISAALFEDGVKSGKAVLYEGFSAPKDAYTLTAVDGHVVIKCFRAANKPLIIKAEAEGLEAEMTILLTD